MLSRDHSADMVRAADVAGYRHEAPASGDLPHLIATSLVNPSASSEPALIPSGELLGVLLGVGGRCRVGSGKSRSWPLVVMRPMALP